MALKLKIFNAENRPSTGKGKAAQPLILFAKSGNITFSKETVKQYGLKPEMKICIANDEADKKRWFFLLNPDNGIALREKGKTGILQMAHSEVTKSILFHHPTDTQSRSFIVADTIDDDGLVLFELKPRAVK